MRRFFLAACISLFAVSLAPNDGMAEGTILNSVKDAVSGAVSAGKDAIAGVDAGVEEGRKEGSSADGAKVVSNKQELAALLRVKALKVEELGEQTVQVTLAVYNDNEFPVRIVKLSELKSVVLLDAEGFSYPLPDALIQGGDITALGKSATRVRWVFKKIEGKPAVLRLLDEDITLPPAASAK